MNRIFCLETEWDQSLHDLKKTSSVKSLLDFLTTCNNVQYCFRQVATLDDFEYYLKHLEHPSYDNYDMVYLCYHGTAGKIGFANREHMDIMNLIKYDRIFEDKNVHFDSCSTLNMDEDDIRALKRGTKARLISGYTKNVPFLESFLFELWLLNTISRHPSYRAMQIRNLAEKQMPFYVKKLGFVIY